MFHIVLFEPEIPPNTGNIIRLCANTGAHLHLVEPLGFKLEDKQMRRAGLDYHEFSSMQVHPDWEACKTVLSGKRLFAITTKGSSRHTNIEYQADDVFVFGPETRGLPDPVLDEFTSEKRVRLPMLPDSRSLNLSNSAAILVYEAWRQTGFPGGM